MTDTPNLLGWTCPRPLQRYPTIVMGHGAGGRMMSDLIEHLFAPAFNNEWLGQMGDSTALDIAAILGSQTGNQLAFTTDSFVVSPLFFPGGNIGELAVFGTVNDLAMRGAKPAFLSAGFILEEGLPMESLGHIVTSMASACRKAGVMIATGDTKEFTSTLPALGSLHRASISPPRMPFPVMWSWSAGRWAIMGSPSCRSVRG
jgi:hydrogenase expression/formation protein HypE